MLNLAANTNILSLSRDLSVVTATDNVVQIWKRSDLLYTVKVPETVTALSFLPEKKVLFAALIDGTLIRSSLADNHYSWQGLPGISHRLSPSSDGEYLAVATGENVYITHSGKGWSRVVGPNKVVDIEWYKNERLLILYESYIRSVDREGGYVWLKDIYGIPRCLAVHQRKSLFALATTDSLYFYNLAGNLQHVYFIEKAVIDMVFPYRNSSLVLISEDGDMSMVLPSTNSPFLSSVSVLAKPAEKRRAILSTK